MKTVEANEREQLAVRKENIVTLPLGLLGFEQVKQYVLLSSPEEAPFLWLQMLDQGSQGFLVMPPELIVPNYSPDICPSDVEFLGLQNPEDAMVLTICTLRPDGTVTTNLKGPIIVNRRTFVGKQVIPSNVSTFALQHPVQQISVAA